MFIPSTSTSSLSLSLDRKKASLPFCDLHSSFFSSVCYSSLSLSKSVFLLRFSAWMFYFCLHLCAHTRMFFFEFNLCVCVHICSVLLLFLIVFLCRLSLSSIVFFLRFIKVNFPLLSSFCILNCDLMLILFLP